MNAVNLAESAWRDFVYAARSFRLNKAFFAVATLSLGLGIGANTAIFQLLDAVRLRTLPIANPERLAELEIAKNDHCCSGDFFARNSNFTNPQWEQIRDRQQAFSSVFAWSDHRFNLAESGEPHYAEGIWVSGDFFKTLSVRPLLGRLISSKDDYAGCSAPGVVISYPFWQRQFAGDPAAIGKQLLLNGHKLDISGITPASFYGVEVGRSFDVAVPICAESLIGGEDSHLAKREDWWLAIMGRLKPGWTLARASAQLNAISSAVFGETVPAILRPDQAKYYVTYKLEAKPAGAGVSELRENYQEPLYLLLGIAGLVLLIACSNLANLMLARASAREREMAVRLAIGASRSRLIRQLLVESLALTLAGAAVGALLAQFLTSYLVSFISTGSNPVFVDLTLDWRVLCFTAAVAILTCILFGLTPALRATRTDPASAMKSAGRGVTADRQRFSLRRALVISQVALSLVLLVGAFLFVGSLRNLLTLNAGFSQNHLLVVEIDASRVRMAAAARSVLYRNLLADVQNTSGVEQAASARIVPVSGSGWNDVVEMSGQPTKQRMIPWFNRVSTGYFRAMGTPFLAGRDFDEHDTVSAPQVAIVNEEFCNKFLGKTNPIGKEFRILAGPGQPQPVYQIVGLVKNSKYRVLREAFEPLVFVAQNQDKEAGQGISLLVRSGVSLSSLLPALKKTILGQNAGLSFEFRPLETQIMESLLRERLMATLSGFFGVLAAVLATVGLYGVISYMVARRRSEIGIRIALGANRVEIIALVTKEAIFLIAAGLIIGTVLAIAVARTAASMLYGLQPTDPATVTGAILSLAFVAMLASVFPAFRAARIEPMIALRDE